MSSTMAADDERYLTKHGFAKGFRFAPTNLELITILSRKIHGPPLPPKVERILHELSILNHHPEELHDMYEGDKEHRFIYFLSWREFQKPAGGGPAAHRKRQRGGGQDDDGNEPRPVRLAKGGGWKPSGGGQVLHWPEEKGGFVAGKMVTMVFYDHHEGRGSSKEQQVKSQWGMHEFTVPVNPRLLSNKLTKTTRLHDLALYRLYKLRGDDTESDDGTGSNQTPANVSAAAGGHFSAPAGQPSFGIFTGWNQPLTAGASSSRMPPPLPQQQQHYIPNFGHPQFFQHHQYGPRFGGAPASAAHHQRVHPMTMTMPPAYGAGMPGRQLLQFARPPSTGLPGLQSFEFARPPALSQMPPVLPAAAGNLASHQAPYGGARQEGGHSGATHTLPLAPLSSTPPPAADGPVVEELAPMAEQNPAAMVEPGQHVQFAGPEEVPAPIPAENNNQFAEPAVPPPMPADNKDGNGVLAWDLDMGMFDDRYMFTMDELCPTFDEPSTLDSF